MKAMIKTTEALMPPLSIVVFGALLTIYLPLSGAIVVVFGALDTYGRWKDYTYLARFDYLDERTALFYGASRCGRHIVCTIDPRWKMFYQKKGYYWWHFLPRGFPFCLLNRRFWRAIFKGHRY